VIPPATFVAAVLLLLAWNVTVGGRIAQLRTAPTAFRLLSGLCGFLVAPALLVFVGGESELTGRALSGLGWLWPIVTVLFVAQAGYALRREAASRWIMVPLVAFNVIVAVAASARYAGSLGYDLPVVALTPGLALANSLSLVFGQSMFGSPFAIVVPLLAPGGPATSVFGAASRAALTALLCVSLVTLAAEGYSASAALRGYAQLGTDRVSELVMTRDQGSLATGLRILPTLTRVPPASMLRSDLDLADSLGVDALLVRVTPECTAAALDSLDRALESFRMDSSLLIVALSFTRQRGRELLPAGVIEIEQNADVVDRIVRRLKPDYIIPADAPSGAGASAVRSVAWWRRYFTVTALVAHGARPATRVMLTTAGDGALDSTLFEWAVAKDSPIDATGFVIAPAIGGATRVRATLDAADRWMKRAGGAREQWLIAAAAPTLEGEEAQRRVTRHVLLWGAARPQLKGVVLADAADYDRMTGFRAPGGRLRRATAEAAATIRALAEPSTPLP
jgi:hypothetical protein